MCARSGISPEPPSAPAIFASTSSRSSAAFGDPGRRRSATRDNFVARGWPVAGSTHARATECERASGLSSVAPEIGMEPSIGTGSPEITAQELRSTPKNCSRYSAPAAPPAREALVPMHRNWGDPGSIPSRDRSERTIIATSEPCVPR